MGALEQKLVEKYGILDDDTPVSTLEINETIKELSYLTHSHFRYYGKFPSKLAKVFLDKYSTTNTVLFDNYVGSGTSLVEAKLKGIPSFGIDINPLAVLASNVKTTCFDITNLEKDWNDIKQKINQPEHKKGWEECVPEWKQVNKWFFEKTMKDLACLKKALLEHEYTTPEARQFFLLGYFGIIRRVSKAFDGEVRPHLNKEKKERDVYATYSKKIEEMMVDSYEFKNVCEKDVISQTYLGSNISLSIDFTDLKKKGVNLVLSHPPYLNCFDYIPVYNLELKWGVDVADIWDGFSLNEIKKMETRSWPATSEKTLFEYFENNKKTFSEVYNLMEKGGICGIVIGDSTIKGELIRVHKILASICKEIGFKPVEIIYRTTSYGVGKYAYQSRADYHGEGTKRDGILVLKK